jgi:hypothetical protein
MTSRRVRNPKRDWRPTLRREAVILVALGARWRRNRQMRPSRNPREWPCTCSPAVETTSNLSWHWHSPCESRCDSALSRNLIYLRTRQQTSTQPTELCDVALQGLLSPGTCGPVVVRMYAAQEYEPLVLPFVGGEDKLSRGLSFFGLSHFEVQTRLKPHVSAARPYCACQCRKTIPRETFAGDNNVNDDSALVDMRGFLPDVRPAIHEDASTSN